MNVRKAAKKTRFSAKSFSRTYSREMLPDKDTINFERKNFLFYSFLLNMMIFS